MALATPWLQGKHHAPGGCAPCGHNDWQDKPTRAIGEWRRDE